MSLIITRKALDELYEDQEGQSAFIVKISVNPLFLARTQFCH